VALAENYEHNTEAFHDYLAHLAPQGRLVVQVHDAAEALKTVFMALGALQQRGIGGPAALQHVVLLQRDPGMLEAPDTIHYPMLLLKNTPYTPVESRQQARLAQEAHVTPLFIPHALTTGFLDTLIQSAAALSFNALPMMWRPATDDRPFFYETETFPASLSWLLSVTVLLLLGLHLWHYRRQQPRTTLTTVSTGWLAFFAGTGCAALLAQVALVQRSVLVLGTPHSLWSSYSFRCSVVGEWGAWPVRHCAIAPCGGCSRGVALCWDCSSACTLSPSPVCWPGSNSMPCWRALWRRWGC
jgi:hypothetical protein